MAQIGGDIEQLAQLEATLNRESVTVEELTRTITGQLQSTAWQGPAADRFRAAWSGEYEVALRRLREALEEASAEVARRKTALIDVGG